MALKQNYLNKIIKNNNEKKIKMQFKINQQC